VTPERYRRAGELFDKLIGLPAARQQDYLDVACGSDDDLRQYVAGLLEAEQKAPDSFLARPAVEDAVNRIAERAAASPTVTGTQLGAYVVGQQIGAGGMGTVYEARDVRLDRKVAIKILPPAFTGDSDRIRRFRQEARAVSLLNHPNIVSIYDAELEQGRCYIATEFVEGKTLRQLAAGRPIDTNLLLDLAIQICSALGAAHQAGIVHRDIKPENVMVRPDGIVKVLDFGLAKLTDPIAGEQTRDPLNATATLQSRPGSIAGTLHYLSPEQVMGKPATPQSDIFSLGVMLYELATGVPPFAGPTEGVVFSAILNQTPARPSTQRPSVSRDLDALIMRTLEKDPELRFQTANDLRSTLKLLVRGSQSGTSAAPPPGAAIPARVPVRRYAAWVLAATAVVVAAAGWLILRPAPGTLPNQFTRLTDMPGEELYPNLTPDGNQFFYASAARGKWDIYLQRTGGSAAVNLTADSPDDDTEPALSHDGSRIAFRSERGGGGLFVMESTGENPTRIAPRGHLPAWSPGGKSIVYCDETFNVPSERGPPASRLHVIDLASGDQRDLQTGDAIQPSWSPHGYRIAYWSMVHGSQRDIWTVGAEGTKPLAVTDDTALDWNPVWSPSGEELYFISDRGGSMNLWRVRIDERTGETRGAPQPFTLPASYIKFLHWSADGKKFIYTQAERRVTLASIEFDRTRMETIGDPVPVAAVNNNITNFSFSPDGSKIVYDTVGDPHEDLWISNLNGSGRRRLIAGGLNRAPAWSPNGEEIVFFSNRRGLYDQWLIRPDGSGLRQLTAVTLAGNQMQAAVWIDGGKRILVGRQSGGPSILDPHSGSPANDLPSLPGFEGAGRGFLFFGPPANGMLIGDIDGTVRVIGRYSVTAGKLERLGIEGARPVWVPSGGDRQFVFKRGTTCYLYDLDLKREKRLFSVAPNKIYALRFDQSGRRIYFTQTIRDADLWMGQMRSGR
jgi:Tol biopolymer transport system component